MLAGAPHDKDSIPYDLLSYTIYAERWGWHPSQVDDLTLEQEDWLIPIAQAIDAEHARREAKRQREAERKNK